ncbi:hypothetical protein BT093_11775, partial [Corynebacterium diphtheriae]
AYTLRMRACPLRRLVTALAVLALLLTGFSAASGTAAEPPCEMGMAMSGGAPCDEGHGDAPDGARHGAAALACFAKCPAPVLGEPMSA